MKTMAGRALTKPYHVERLSPKRKRIVEIIGALMIVFFVHSSIVNYFGMQSMINMLAFYTVHTTEYAWAFWGTEVMIALLLIIPSTRIVGLVMTVLFMAGMVTLILMTPHYPHNFGGLLGYISDTRHLVYEITLGVLALAALLLCIPRRRKEEPEPLPVIFT
jgi:hypothetical protein